VLLIIPIRTVLHTIDLSAKFVSKERKKLRRQKLDGSPVDIRKKPHAIDVVLEVSMPHSYWYIM
jgi:hypothetical protein